MAKNGKKQYEQVLDILKEANHELVSYAQFEEKLGVDIAKKRLPSWIWDCKKKANVPVEREMNGVKVVGWFIPKALVPVVAPASDESGGDIK